MRIDLHVHTTYSFDCWMSLASIVRAMRKGKVEAIAVLDHDQIEGAKRLAEMAPFPVIIGQEVLTTEGEIGGLFLKEMIPPGVPLEETVERIKEQGGLVYATHPLAKDAPQSIGRKALEAILERVDIIEGFNARIRHREDNEAARELAQSRAIAIGAGSDAHFPWEIGRAGVEIKEFSTPQEFLSNLQEGQVFGRRSPYLFAGLTYLLWLLHRFLGA